MPKQNRDISVPKKGMIKDIHPESLTKEQYIYALNASFESQGGDLLNLQNEESNILCYKFAEGFKVIGLDYDINTATTFFALTNPDTGHSEIGYIVSSDGQLSMTDTLEECGCDVNLVLSEGLENIEQVGYCQYTTLLKDYDCEGSGSGCLNFQIKYPVDMTIKQDKAERVLYLTDDFNPPRRIELDNPEIYQTETTACSDQEDCPDCGTIETPVCLNCERMLLFPNYTKPCIDFKGLINGGNVKHGVYVFYVAYSDEFGNNLTPYTTKTNVIPVKDQNKDIYQQPELDSPTNYSIKIEVNDLDTTFKYYNVAVSQVNEVDGTVSQFLVGTYPIGQNTVIYNGERNKTRLTTEQLLAQRPTYTKAKNVEQVNNTLFLSDLESQTEINLQPVVNLMGQFAKWRTVVANEDLYEDAIGTEKYKGYMRDEVVPFAIRFVLKNGYKTADFPLISRLPVGDTFLLQLESDLYFDQTHQADPEGVITDLANSTPDPINEGEFIDPENRNWTWEKDVYSALKWGNTNCDTPQRIYKWQYYNTAQTEADPDCGTITGGETIERTQTRYCISEVDGEIPEETTLTIDTFDDPDSTYTNIIDYINNNQTTIEALGSDWDAFKKSTYEITDNCCDPEELFDDVCEVNETPISKSAFFRLLDGTETATITYETCSSLTPPAQPSSCGNFGLETDGSKTELSRDDYVNGSSPGTVYDYLSTGAGGDSCALATAIPNNGTSVSFSIGTDFGGTARANLLSSKSAHADAGAGYSDNTLANSARWFKVDTTNIDNLTLGFSQTNTTASGDLDVADTIRVNTYDGCSASSPEGVFASVDLTTGGNVCIDTSSIDELYVAVDTEISTNNNGVDDYYYTAPTEDCIAISAYPTPIEEVEVTFSEGAELKVELTCEFEATCTFSVLDKLKCDPFVATQGVFSYWESVEQYPDNNALWNSSNLTIDPSTDIPASIRSEFEDKFMSGGSLDPDVTDFRCKPIRHFRFPDFAKSPTFNREAIPHRDNLIYPIGFHIDNEIINAFLNIAQNNGLITPELRSQIVGYEIMRGDVRLNKSIVAKGLIYDMWRYIDQAEESSEYANPFSTDKQVTWFASFPYNDRSPNTLLYNAEDRIEHLRHPYADSNYTNNRFMFHSPEIHFNKPALGFEMYRESDFMGYSRGRFSEVKDHPKFVVLSEKARTRARTLASFEVIFEIMSGATLRASSGGGIPGVVNSLAQAGIYTVSALLDAYNAGQRKVYEWMSIFDANGKADNFAYYYSSVGKYNTWNTSFTAGNGERLRGLNERQYLKPGRFSINEDETNTPTIINHFNRESGVYLYTGNEVTHGLTPHPGFRTYDRSTFEQSLSEQGCENKTLSGESDERIMSSYVSIKNYVPDQHGTIDSIQWISTGYCGDLTVDNACDVVFGGDTFLSRFAIKRKFPLFLNSMINSQGALGDRTPFSYSEQRNVGHPTYFLDSKVDQGTPYGGDFSSDATPNIGSIFNFDCETRGDEDSYSSDNYGNFRSKLYMVPPSKFYLYYYGIPYFIVESRYNLNYRHGENERERDFWPNQQDYIEWTQERNVSIEEDNYFFYNNTFSAESTLYPYRSLPATYNKEEWDKREDHYDRVIYSLPDNNEQDLEDKFRIFLANNFNDFGSKYGKFYGIKQIESQKGIGRFENGMVLFNTTNVLQGDVENIEVGTGDMFKTRPVEFHKTDLGHGGTQHRAFVSSQFGHYWVDAKRGRVYSINPAGGGMEEISSYGMKNWFRENLPFTIQKRLPGVEGDVIDNAYNGLGIAMGWDDRLNRLFITKQDADIKEEYRGRITFDTETKSFLLDEDTEVETTDETYFDRIEWTVAYSPISESWISYYSFKPNYYITKENYFQTGYNFGEAGLWSHLKSNSQSFQVFQGTLYPFIVEAVLQSDLQTKQLEDVSWRIDTRRYEDEYNYAEYDLNFDEVVVFNKGESTGLVKLIEHDEQNFSQLVNYPKHNTDHIEALSINEDYVWSFNTMFDNTKPNQNQPIWRWAKNNAEKEINQAAHDYRPFFKDMMKGQMFFVHLRQTKESRIKMIFNHLVQNNNTWDAY